MTEKQLGLVIGGSSAHSELRKPVFVGFAQLDGNINLVMKEFCEECRANHSIENILSHESIHIVLLNLEGEEAYRKFDKLCYPKVHDGLGFGLLLENFKGVKKHDKSL